MQEVQNIRLADSGLRERKRAQTHARIQDAAVGLFLAQGFEATTMDQIADAAGVSRRSLFHYFSSKEEIVLSTKAGFPAMIGAAVMARPADEPLLDMVENAFLDLASAPRDARSEALGRLISTTPSLATADQAKYAAVEQALAVALATRKGLPADNLACRVTASIGVGILKLATQAWLVNGHDAPEVFGKAAFAELRRLAGG